MPRDTTTPDPRREYQRSRILAALADGPLTAQQLADRLHLSRSGATWHLQSLRSETPRLVRIAGYAPSPKRQRSAPLYGLGGKADAKCVKTRAPKGRITVEDRHAQILTLLAERPRTAAEVVSRMLLQRARIYVFDLHAAGKLHIASWKQDATGAYRSPVYAVGPGHDAVRPAPQAEHEKCVRYWTKLKSDPKRYDHYLHRNRMRKKPQTWLSALMG